MVFPESYQDGNKNHEKYLKYQPILELIKNWSEDSDSGHWQCGTVRIWRRHMTKVI